jgi:hypothetical protein
MSSEEWDEWAAHEMAAVGSIDHLPPRPWNRPNKDQGAPS